MSSPTWRRCVFVVSLLLLTSFSRYSCGQETTATIADEAAAAADSDIEYDATESVIDLDAATAAAAADETACGVVDDVDVKTPDDEVAATTTADGETSSESAAADDERTAEGGDETTSTDSAESTKGSQAVSPVVQSGPFVDLLGDLLISLEMIDETKAQVHQHHTNVALDGKKVVGLYFSADW